MRRPRLLLAAEHQMLLDALNGHLEPSYDVVGLVNDGRALLTVAEKLQPDVIVLDISTSKVKGLDAGRQLKQLMPSMKLIFMTMHEDPYLVDEAFRAGASAFLLKQGAASELNEAIDRALKGRKYLTPRATAGLEAISLQRPKDRDHARGPSTREREVIQLLAEGHTMSEAAARLKITTRTVCAHKYNAMERLQIKTNAELIQYAVKHRLISD
jgi:DNA-binding NarL/FixJ family response regulator